MERERERLKRAGREGRGPGCKRGLNKHFATVEFAGIATWSNCALEEFKIWVGILCRVAYHSS